MNRLHHELQRLYQGDAQGRVRGVVMELARPAEWSALARVWRGVQTDFEWPAPAIAVSGRDGFQLWFSLAEALPPAQALDGMAALQRHYLAEIASARIRIQLGDVAHAPPQSVMPGQWSAFVAPDLAPVFAEDPWLDTLPSAEGQADLLQRLGSIKAAEWARLMEDLALVPAASPAAVPATEAGTETDPRRFLLRVMNDASVDMALRIEAAKALLPGTGAPPRA